MRKFMSMLCGAAMTVTSIAALAAPSQAAPVQVPRLESGNANLVEVQNRRGFERRGDRYYYNGQRGYRERRAGWRQSNGYWFPPAAFLGGVIIGGAIANQPVRRVNNNRHVRWCVNNYRSYRVSNNTWKPVGQPRRQCNSPFD